MTTEAKPDELLYDYEVAFWHLTEYAALLQDIRTTSDPTTPEGTLAASLFLALAGGFRHAADECTRYAAIVDGRSVAVSTPDDDEQGARILLTVTDAPTAVALKALAADEDYAIVGVDFHEDAEDEFDLDPTNYVFWDPNTFPPEEKILVHFVESQQHAEKIATRWASHAELLAPIRVSTTAETMYYDPDQDLVVAPARLARAEIIPTFVAMQRALVEAEAEADGDAPKA